MNFSEAVKAVNNLNKLDTHAQLKLYGLFKQATIGDINILKPGVFNARGRAKYNAWYERRGLSSAESELLYIKLVSELL
jgi:diazepam-binding inhibitor (GABA receptor modulating acyl-CoA-binding protein)